MPSRIVTATVQAAILSATSNVLAQVISAYRSNKPLTLDPIPIFQFILFTLITCPPNFLWQQYLEQKFPGHVPEAPRSSYDALDEKRSNGGAQQNRRLGITTPQLHVRNTLTKLLLDQTLAAAVNTVGFIAIMGGLRGASSGEIGAAVRKDFWPVTKAGLKLWPLVSLLCFSVVPVHQRVVVGSLVGVGWGVYLSLLAAR